MQQCTQCNEQYEPKSKNSIYCSVKCRERAKYLRVLATGYEQVKRDRRNAKYVAEIAAGKIPSVRLRQIERDRARGVRSQKTEVDGICPECFGSFSGVLGKVFCSPLCRRRARNKRDRDKKPMFRQDVIIRGTFNGVRRNLLATVIENGGMWIYCLRHPGQRVFMGVTDFEAGSRGCTYCGSTLTVNMEEIEWVIYETLLTKRSKESASGS